MVGNGVGAGDGVGAHGGSVGNDVGVGTIVVVVGGVVVLQRMAWIRGTKNKCPLVITPPRAASLLRVSASASVVVGGGKWW